MKKSKRYCKQMLALTHKTIESDVYGRDSPHPIIRNIVIRSSDNPYKEIVAYHVVDHRFIYLVCKKRLVADRCCRSRDAI